MTQSRLRASLKGQQIEGTLAAGSPVFLQKIAEVNGPNCRKRPE
jgi:hypothetical protein